MLVSGAIGRGAYDTRRVGDAPLTDLGPLGTLDRGARPGRSAGACMAGESLVALESAPYFVREGNRHWFLRREEETGEVLTYIHNVNLGAFLVNGSVLLWGQSPLPAAIGSAVGVVAGVVCAYPFVERASGPARRIAFTL